MKTIIILISVLISQILFSQNKEHSGVVYDGGLPLPAVKVSIEELNKSTLTDFDGLFKIVVPDSIKTLTFSYIGYQTINYKLDEEKFIELNMSVPQERGIWISIGSFSDIQYAPYGLSISNGQEEENLLHFEDFQEDVSLKFAIATDLDDNLTYETKLIYHNHLVKGYFFNTSLEYVVKDYSNLKFKDYNISTNVSYFQTINSLLNVKFGVQEFNDKKGFGGALGIERKHYDLLLQYGGQIGYWNDYFTYKLYLRKFIFQDKFSLIAKFNNINRTSFFTVGVHFLFKTTKDKY